MDLLPRSPRTGAPGGRGSRRRGHGDAGREKIVTITDDQGIYKLTTGTAWTIRIEMLGFSPLTQEVTMPTAQSPTFALKVLPFEEMVGFVPIVQDVTISQNASPLTFDLKLQPYEEMQKIATVSAAPIAPGAPLPRNAPRAPNTPPAPEADAASATDQSADGLLINGSVNNGAASPFAQLAAFGNNRRNARSLYNGGVGVLLGNSALDTRPYSFSICLRQSPATTTCRSRVPSAAR
jgi:hypothetical protein